MSTKEKLLAIAARTGNGKSDNATPAKSATSTETTVDEFGDTVVTVTTTTQHDPAGVVPTVEQMIRNLKAFEHGLSSLVNSPFKEIVSSQFAKLDRVISGIHETRDYACAISERAKYTCDPAHWLLCACYELKATLLNAQVIELQQKCNKHLAPWQVVAELSEMLPQDEEIPF